MSQTFKMMKRMEAQQRGTDSVLAYVEKVVTFVADTVTTQQQTVEKIERQMPQGKLRAEKGGSPFDTKDKDGAPETELPAWVTELLAQQEKVIRYQQETALVQLRRQNEMSKQLEALQLDMAKVMERIGPSGGNGLLTPPGRVIPNGVAPRLARGKGAAMDGCCSAEAKETPQGSQRG